MINLGTQCQNIGKYIGARMLVIHRALEINSVCIAVDACIEHCPELLVYFWKFKMLFLNKATKVMSLDSNTTDCC